MKRWRQGRNTQKDDRQRDEETGHQCSFSDHSHHWPMTSWPLSLTSQWVALKVTSKDYKARLAALKSGLSCFCFYLHHFLTLAVYFQAFKIWFRHFKCFLNVCVWTRNVNNIRTVRKCIYYMCIIQVLSCGQGGCQGRIMPTQCQRSRKPKQAGSHVNHKSLSCNPASHIRPSLKDGTGD